MEAKHTPGPWFHSCDEGNTGGCNINVANYVIAEMQDVGDFENAEDSEVNEWAERREANARLIAAAPDLLAALEAVLRECVLIHRYGGDGNNARAADAARGAAHTAITKARGV